jgi:hypothetical protein
MIAAFYSAIHRPPDGAHDQLDPAILIDIMPVLMHGISSGIIIDRPRPPSDHVDLGLAAAGVQVRRSHRLRSTAWSGSALRGR